jgi:hypothetical protein
MVRENEALRSRVTLLERDLALRTKQVHTLAQLTARGGKGFYSGL